MFQKCCNMNHIIKIYCWAEISAQSKLHFSFTWLWGSFLSNKSFFTFSEGYFGTLLRPKFFMVGVTWITVSKSNLGLGFLGKNRLNLFISYHFVVIFVQKVNFGLFRGAILGFFEAYTFDNVSIYEAWTVVWLNYCPISLKYHHF